MGIGDGFMFWLGKVLADIAVGGIVIVLFMLFCGLIVWWSSRK